MVYHIEEKLLSQNRPGKPLNAEGVVIHSTATPGATALDEYHYFNSEYRAASAHYFIDWNRIIRTIPEIEIAWHAAKTANQKFLSVEMCETKELNEEKFKEVWYRTIWLTADICFRYGWDLSTVYSHAQVSKLWGETNHIDPEPYLKRFRKSWSVFLDEVSLELKRRQDKKSGFNERNSTNPSDHLNNALIQNLVVVELGPDVGAAQYLANYLAAPVAFLNNVSKEYLEKSKNIYMVGGTIKPTARAVLISGSDRYETCQKVLEFIENFQHSQSI